MSETFLGETLIATGSGTTTLAASGLFVCDRRTPATGFLGGWLATTASGHVETGLDRQTNRPGIFACGDVASPAQRIALAIADGEKAGQNAVRWVRSKAAGT